MKWALLSREMGRYRVCAMECHVPGSYGDHAVINALLTQADACYSTTSIVAIAWYAATFPWESFATQGIPRYRNAQDHAMHAFEGTRNCDAVSCNAHTRQPANVHFALLGFPER